MAIERVTMFKLPAEYISALVSAYNTMSAQSTKDGKPYILSLKVGPTDASDPRNNGFTFAAVSRFASLNDMKYYDEGDQAHQELKAFLKDKHQGAMTVYFENAL